MNLTINRYHSNQHYHQPDQCGPQDSYRDFNPPQPLGDRKSGMGSMIGGLVGGILGQIFCPIPFVGAMLGGLLGSMFGSMLDNMFGASAPCCCHNMGQHYGPHNQQMGSCYGYPMDYPYLPPGFPNQPWGQAPPLFPEDRPLPNTLGLPIIGPSVGSSNHHLAPGELHRQEVRNDNAGVRVETEIRREQDGSSTLEVDSKNRQAPDAALDSTTTVGPGGSIETVSAPVVGGVRTDSLAQNSDGTAATLETTVATERQTDVVITDVDAAAGNMQVAADNDTVVVRNPGSGEGGAVETKVDIAESSSDGFFENLGRGVASLNPFAAEEPKPVVSADGVGQVQVTKNEEGQATVTVDKGNGAKPILTTAGDTDDSFIERAGEVVDNTISTVGHVIGDAAEAVGNVASGAVNAVGDAANGAVSWVRSWF